MISKITGERLCGSQVMRHINLHSSHWHTLIFSNCEIVYDEPIIWEPSRNVVFEGCIVRPDGV